MKLPNWLAEAAFRLVIVFFTVRGFLIGADWRALNKALHIELRLAKSRRARGLLR